MCVAVTGKGHTLASKAICNCKTKCVLSEGKDIKQTTMAPSLYIGTNSNDSRKYNEQNVPQYPFDESFGRWFCMNHSLTLSLLCVGLPQPVLTKILQSVTFS